MERFDVVVVGGGAMGSAAAWQLSRRGQHVLLLEQFERGHNRGGSHGASRIFRLAYPEEDYVRLAERALPLWRELEEEAGVELLAQTGGLDHGLAQSVDLIARSLAACGVKFEELDSAEAGRRWPGIRFEGRVLHQPDAGRVNADAAVSALQDAATARGADVRFSAKVESIDETEQFVRVVTQERTFDALVAVVAVGSWATKLLPEIPLPRITVTAEQPAHFRPVDDTVWPSFVHYSPGGDRLHGFGAYGLESPGEGVKVGEHGTGPVVDPDARSTDADAALLERLRRYVVEWLPGLDPAPVSWTTCLYDSTPTTDFVLDRRGRVVVATGFSGHGFKFVPEVGRVLADLAQGDDTSTLPRFRLHR